VSTYTEAVPDVNLSLAAGFQSYVQHVISMFTNANSGILTRTTDTNQIDALTVPQPGTTTTTSGNWASLPALFRFYDGLGNDIFISLRFGVFKNTSGTSSTDLGVPLLGVTLGRGSDGAGNLTGIYGPEFLMMGAPGNGNVNTTRGTKTSYACCRDGYMVIFIERDMNNDDSNWQLNQGALLAISFKSTGGAFTVYSCNNGYNGGNVKTYPTYYGNTIGSTNNISNPLGVKGLCFSVEEGPYGNFSDYQHLIRKPSVPSSTTGVWNGDTNVFRVDCWHPSVGSWKDPNVIAYYNGDFTSTSTQAITVDTESRTFIFFNPSLKAFLPSGVCVGLRWD